MKLEKLRKAVVFTVLVLLLLLTLIPFMLMLFLSVRDHLDVQMEFWSIPSQLKWENYSIAYDSILRPIGNSLYVCLVTVVIGLIIGSLSGYVFARHRFPGKNAFYMMLIGVMMVPSLLTIVPLYAVISELRLSGSFWALILPYIAGTQLLGVLLCRTFFESLSEELFEAARIDGGSELYLYSRIALPLSVPILVTVGIVNFLSVYNDYVWPLLVLNQEHYTFTLAAVNLTNAGKADIGLSSAAYVIGSLPTAVVLMFGMKFYIEGMTHGALKS